MSVEVVMESPLAHALNESIQPKLVEVGWSTGGADDSALSEYIILMLVNGKTQDQIAAELSGDLLNLGPDDPGARDFSQWLFEQVDILNHQLSSGESGYPMSDLGNGLAQGDLAQDATVGDASETGDSFVPRGPKSMRNGNSASSRHRDRRMLGALTKAMDRSNDNVLHRVRPQAGHERVNTHARGPPTGPRGGVGGRGGLRPQNGMLNGRPNGMAGIPMQGAGAHGIMNMSAQQQLDLYALLEQQSRMMAQMFNPPQAGMMGGPGFVPQQQQQGRSLFERVQPNPQRPNGFPKRPQDYNKTRSDENPSQPESFSASMDTDMTPSTEPKRDKLDSLSPNTTCKFNLTCTNKDCKFAHQSPAAPPGTAIDVSDICTFGAACKNRKCVARHCSPAQKLAHQTTLDCKFYPNCTNARCPFRHPDMPLCRNGPDCTSLGCKFTHVKTMCRHNPCLNPSCAFKHTEGQKRGKFDDKVWIADGLKEKKEHVSERKFIDEDVGGQEELITGREEGGKDTGGTMEQDHSAEGEVI